MLLLLNAAAVAFSYGEHRGYLPVGADVANATDTIDSARRLCDSIGRCQGFTFAPSSRQDPKLSIIDPKQRFQIWLKSSSEWVSNKDYYTHIKQRPKCPNLRFGTAERDGPYCCEGDGCPLDGGSYAALEAECTLPAEVPLGAAHCSTLHGGGLVNLAASKRYSTLSASSEYPHKENAGLEALTDGRVDRSFFHSKCEDGPQWLRIQFATPVAIAQLALHNRPEFLYRLANARVTFFHTTPLGLVEPVENGTYALGSASRLYLLNFEHFIQKVTMLELRLAEKNTCLHLTQVQVWGGRQDSFEQGKLGFEWKFPGSIRQPVLAPGRNGPPSAPTVSPAAAAAAKAVETPAAAAAANAAAANAAAARAAAVEAAAARAAAARAEAVKAAAARAAAAKAAAMPKLRAIRADGSSVGVATVGAAAEQGRGAAAEQGRGATAEQGRGAAAEQGRGAAAEQGRGAAAEQGRGAVAEQGGSTLIDEV